METILGFKKVTKVGEHRYNIEFEKFTLELTEDNKIYSASFCLNVASDKVKNIKEQCKIIISKQQELGLLKSNLLKDVNSLKIK
jgi:hypothetical protein